MAFCTRKIPVLCAVNVNWNEDGWNVNANSISNPNRWNDGNQIFSRNYCLSPLMFIGGVLLSNPFFQPPSWRPISSSPCKSSEYLSVGINLPSQANWVKNFTTSILAIALVIHGDLFSLGR